MKSAAKKLIASAIVLVVALSLAVTSTFAWFTMSNDPKVTSFNVNVTTSNGLLISATGDEGTYKATLPSLDIIKAYYAEVEGKESLTAFDLDLTAVTSADGIAFKKIDGTTAADAGSYLSFNLYFLSNTAQTIKLQTSVDNTGVTSTRGANINSVKYWSETEKAIGYYGAAQTTALNLGDAIEADAQNAVRVSFVNGSTAKVWYPNSGTGYNHATNNVALDYYNYLYGTSLTVPSTVTSIVSSDIYGDTLLTLTADATAGGFTGVLTVNIWLAGYDGDCLDSIFADVISTKLQFIGASVS